MNEPDRQVGLSRRAVVYADYGQFYVQDVEHYDQWMRAGAAMDPDLPPAGWTEVAVQVHRIGVEKFSLSVGTARTDHVETLLHVHPSAPPYLDIAEHIVEADLDVLSGLVSVVGCTEDPGPQHQVKVAACRYRARVSYIPSLPAKQAITPWLPGDYFVYRVDMWPAESETSLTVVKQGPVPWAG